MELIFEKSVSGRGCSILPACDVETASLPANLSREEPPVLPEMAEVDISRHYTELCGNVHGVNSGFYPLGSCTMKYNPRIDEEMAALPGFTCITRWLRPIPLRVAKRSLIPLKNIFAKFSV